MLTLVVDDDEDYASLVEYTLKRGGHEVVTAHSAGAALSFAKRRTPDFAILDVLLPDGSGLDLCRAMKATAPEMGVLFLSSIDARTTVVEGLERGGDDYLTKPFHPNELLARVGAVARRSQIAGVPAPVQGRQELAGFVADTVEGRATYMGRDLRCTRREVELLAQLLMYPDEVLTYEFLSDRLWGFPNFDESTLLKGHVSKLRKKMCDVGAPEGYIKTIHNVGYSFIPEQEA